MGTLNFLFEVTIYSSVIFIAIILLKTCFKNKISPLLHYAVWFVLVLRLILPVTIASPVRLFVIPAVSQNTGIKIQDIHQPVILPETSTAVTANTQPRSEEAANRVQNETRTMSETAHAPLSLNLPQIVTLAWLAGTVICLSYLAALYVSLGRRIRRNSARPSKRLIELFEQAKAEMGVKADIKLVCQYEYGTPSLMFPKTIMMPTDALVAMDDEQTRFALRHELMHFKHGDHLLIILLSLLNAFYWFNPIVWAAYRLMRKDMEAACDGAVVKRFDSAAKGRYASLIINLSAQPVHRQLVLGMSRSGLKKAAERRIKCIFMKGESGMGVKLVTVLLAAVLLFTCFTTACQPTPEKPVIVNKNDGKLEETLRESPKPPESYKASEHWNETVQNDKLKIVIDTDVFVPDVTEYPVVKLEHAVFSQQRIDELVSYFAQGKQLHLPHVMSKADYEPFIISAKRGDFIGGKYVVTPESLDYVKYLEEKQAAAPEDSPVINTGTALTYQRNPETGEEITEYGKNFLNVAFDNGNGKEASIGIASSGPGNSAGACLIYTAGERGISESEYQNMQEIGAIGGENSLAGGEELFDKVEITREEAVEKADEVISGLGIKHMMLVHAEKCVASDASENSGYKLDYARESGGIPLYPIVEGGGFRGEEPPQYSPPFMEETLTAYVSKKGLTSLIWAGCADVAETVNTNVELLPFETIQQRLKDQIFYKNSFMKEGYCRDLTVTITSAELRTGYIGVKDNPYQALMVPVWVFESRISYCESSGTQQDYKDNTYMLNAIDGGVIELARESIEF